MSSATLVVSPRELDGDEVRVEGEGYRHLFRARRLAVGDRIRVVDGAGRAREGAISAVGPRAATLELGEPVPANEPPLAVELFVALPRGRRAAWLVEKATEVGVSAIRFFTGERAPRQIGPAALERLGRVAVAAVEQSGRARVPELGGPLTLAEAIAAGGGCSARWLLEPRSPGALDPRRRPPREGSLALYVGPEGGFSAEERAALQAAGCAPVGLGSTTLRTETAAVAGAALALAAASVSIDTRPDPR